MSWVLKDVTTQEEKQIVLNGTDKYEIGRRRNISNGLICYSPVVSKYHAYITILANGNLQVVDLQSANGTFINNIKIKQQTPNILKHEDEIGFGVCRDNHKNYSKPYYLYTLLKPADCDNINIMHDKQSRINDNESHDRNDNIHNAEYCSNIQTRSDKNSEVGNNSEKNSNSAKISTILVVKDNPINTGTKRDLPTSSSHHSKNLENSVIEIIDLLDDEETEFTVINKKSKTAINEPNQNSQMIKHLDVNSSLNKMEVDLFNKPCQPPTTESIASTSKNMHANFSSMVALNNMQTSTTVEIPSDFDLYMKSEIKEEKEIIDLSYSMNDDLIVIDDEDEDNYDLMCSQLFIKVETNTPANIDNKETIDIDFLDIKREIAELDRIDYIPSPVSIDSDSNYSFGCLDDTEPEVHLVSHNKDIKSENVNDLPVKFMPVLPSDFKNNVNINESIDIIHYKSYVTINQNDDDSLNNDSDSVKSNLAVVANGTPQSAIDEYKSNDDLLRDLESESPVITKVPTKIHKTIEIEALFMPTRSRAARVSPEKKLTEKKPTEKKPTEKKTPKKKSIEKKSEKAKLGKRKRGSTEELVMGKQVKEQIKKVRMKKLKEIVEKCPPKHEQQQIKKPTAKVKVSCPRGDFLLANNCVTASSTIKPKQIDLPSTSGMNTRSAQKSTTRNSGDLKRIPKKIAQPLDSEKKLQVAFPPKTIVNWEPNVPAQTNLITRNIQQPAPRNVNIPTNGSASTFRNNTDYNSRTNTRQITEYNRPNYATHNKPSLMTQYPDMIIQLISWNAKWCEEHVNAKIAPPVTSKPCVRMCKSFANYNYYCEVMHPLIILDVWFTISKNFESTQFNANTKDTFLGSITHIQRASTHFELTCSILLSRAERDAGQFVQEKYFTLISIPVEGPAKAYKKLFGVVSSLNIRLLKSTDQIDEYRKSQHLGLKCGNPEFNLSITIIVKACRDQISMKRRMYGRYFTSLAQHFNLFKAVETLKDSPLCSFILDPLANKFIMPYIPNKAIKIKDELNSIQNEAVLEAVYFSKQTEPGVYLIEGPPGTGKTTIISNIVLQVLLKQSDACVLLLAPSNATIDSFINRFHMTYKSNLNKADKHKIKLVRIGKQSAIHQDVIAYTLDELAKSNVKKNFFLEHPATIRDYDALSKELIDLKNQQEMHKDNKDIERKIKEVKNKKDYFPKLYWNDNVKYNKKLHDQKILTLRGANLVCSTLGSITKLKSYNFIYNRFTVCIIDEATQCSEVENLMPIVLGVKKFILVGDPQQLPATTSSILVKNFDYGMSLFSRIKYHLDKCPVNPIKMMTLQYRMHPEICSYPSQTFYKGLLKTGDVRKDTRGLDRLAPYMIFNHNVQSPRPNQYLNTNEVDIVAMLVEAIISIIGSAKFNIGIITPYSVQRDAINRKLQSIKPRNNNVDICCNTVDSFQGQEKDVILLSCVRNCPNFFLADEQRLNVAITRAKHALYIVGMQSLFESCMTLNKLKIDALERKLFFLMDCKISNVPFSALISRR